MTLYDIIEINSKFGYVFLRIKEDTETEVLSIKDSNTLSWIPYSLCDSNKVYFKGDGFTFAHAREITEEIVISRANNYKVKVIKAPSDIETNPDAKLFEYDLPSLGKKV